MIFEMACDLTIAWLLGVGFTDNRIDQPRGQFAANPAIDGGQSEFKGALDEQLLVDHSRKHTPADFVVDRISTVSDHAGEDALVIDSSNDLLADSRGRLSR